MVLSLHIKKRLSVLFLFAFVFIKVGGLHSLAHSDDAKDTQDCVWCHLSGTDNQTPIIVWEETYKILPAQDFGQQKIQDNHYRSVVSSKIPVCLIFNKPPPFYTI
jgi:hypothetical protein